MKRFLLLLLLAPLLLCVPACSEKKAGYVGVNAEILEINAAVKGFVVKSLDVDSVLGESCYISCESDEVYYIYADNKTGETKDLTYSDFIVGDQITIDMPSVENSYALASRIQRSTQR